LAQLWSVLHLQYHSAVVLLVFLAAWIALLLHELAHAVTASCLGVRLWSITLGRGPVLWDGSVGGCRMRIALFPLHGEVRLNDEDAERLGYRDLQSSTWRFVWRSGSWRAPLISAAGAVANMLAVAGILTYWVLVPLLSGYGAALLVCSIVVNTVMFLNLMPIRGLDGWRVAVQAAAWRRSSIGGGATTGGPGQRV
jgi:membrane-associated protease RseP (regulator of RpoE activity)